VNKFTGPVFVPEHDQERLDTQIERIKGFMADGQWHTYGEIALATGSPATSVSSQLRNLRMDENGGFIIERQYRGDRRQGLFEYRLLTAVRSHEYLVARVARRQEIFAEAEARYISAKTQMGLAEKELRDFNNGVPEQMALGL